MMLAGNRPEGDRSEEELEPALARAEGGGGGISKAEGALRSGYLRRSSKCHHSQNDSCCAFTLRLGMPMLLAI